MQLNGYSQKGSGHPENQDAFCCLRGGSGQFALAVSDGLGSNKQSALGSAAFCRSVAQLFRARSGLSAGEFPAALYRLWREELGSARPAECSATGLFAIWQSDVFTLGALGDGIAAAQLPDGQSLVLLDTKDEHFFNETDCLASELRTEQWRIRQVKQRPEAVLLCTDGIEISPGTEETVTRFLREMAQGYAGMDASAVQADIQSWVSDWPGTDDKTIAYYLDTTVVQTVGEQSR